MTEHERELRRRLRRSWDLLAVSFVCAFLAAASSMLYANKVARDSQRQWCGIVTTLDDAYRERPPQSPAGVQMAQDIRRLRGEFGCPVDR